MAKSPASPANASETGPAPATGAPMPMPGAMPGMGGPVTGAPTLAPLPAGTIPATGDPAMGAPTLPPLPAGAIPATGDPGPMGAPIAPPMPGDMGANAPASMAAGAPPPAMNMFTDQPFDLQAELSKSAEVESFHATNPAASAAPLAPPPVEMEGHEPAAPAPPAEAPAIGG